MTPDTLELNREIIEGMALEIPEGYDPEDLLEQGAFIGAAAVEFLLRGGDPEEFPTPADLAAAVVDRYAAIQEDLYYTLGGSAEF